MDNHDIILGKSTKMVGDAGNQIPVDSYIEFTKEKFTPSVQIMPMQSSALCALVCERFKAVFPDLWKVGMDRNDATGEMVFIFYFGVRDPKEHLEDGQVRATRIGGGSVDDASIDLIQTFAGLDHLAAEAPVLFTDQARVLLDKYLMYDRRNNKNFMSVCRSFHDEIEHVDGIAVWSISPDIVCKDIFPDKFVVDVDPGTDGSGAALLMSNPVYYKVQTTGMYVTPNGRMYNLNIVAFDGKQMEKDYATLQFATNAYVGSSDGIARFS